MIFAAAAIVVVGAAIGGLLYFKQNNKDMVNGLETGAVVTRIDEVPTRNTDGTVVLKRTVYVKYRMKNNTRADAVLVNAPGHLLSGSKVRIKYHPDHPETVVMAK